MSSLSICLLPGKQPHSLTTHAHSSAGHWLFCNRRWLSPSHPPDRARLDAGYDALCAAFPAFAACPRHRVLATIAHVSATWSAAMDYHNPRPPAGPTAGSNPSPTPAAGGDGKVPSPAAAAIRVSHLLNPSDSDAWPGHLSVA